MNIVKTSVCGSCAFKDDPLHNHNLIHDATMMVVLDKPKTAKATGLPFIDKDIQSIVANAGFDTTKVCYVYAAMCAGSDAKLSDAAKVCSRLYLARIIAEYKPKTILCCGPDASAFIMRNPAVAMARRSGCVDKYCGASVFYTIDPATLFKSPAGKQRLTQDVSSVLRFLNPRQVTSTGTLVHDQATLNEFATFCKKMIADAAAEQVDVACVIETNMDDYVIPHSRITHVGFCIPGETYGYSVLLDVLRKDPVLFEVATRIIADVLRNPRIRKLIHKSTHGAVFCMFKQFAIANVGDTQVEQFLLNENRSSYELNDCVAKEFGSYQNKTASDSFATGGYNVQDSVYVGRLHQSFTRKAPQKMQKLYNEVICGVTPALYEMMHEGILFDKTKNAATKREVKADLDRLTQELCDAYPCFRGVNLYKTDVVASVIEKSLGVAMVKQSKKTDNASLDKEALLTYAIQMDMKWARMLLKIRSREKIISSYLDTFPKFASYDGRIRPHINIATVTSGRWSIIQPALQTLPRTKEIHKLFVAGKGKRILSWDLSQIELRSGCSIANEPRMIQAYNNNEDIHRLTASSIYETPLVSVTGDQRQIAKPVNFSVMYGQEPMGLKSYLFSEAEIDISFDQSKSFIDNFFALYPEFKSWHGRIRQELLSTGKVIYPTGRERRFPHVAGRANVDDRTMRQAVNAPNQGSANDIMSYATGTLYRLLRKRGLQDRVKFAMTTHDDCVMIMDDSDELMHDVCGLIALILSRIGNHDLFTWLKVPIIAEFKCGDNWGELKKVKVEGMV